MYQGLKDIYDEYGYFSEDQLAIQLEGKAGLDKIKRIMDKFRAEGFPKIEGLTVTEKIDYFSGEVTDIKSGDVKPTGLRQSNVLKYVYDGNDWITLRPSGTEPKIKVYASASEPTKEKSVEKLNLMVKTMKDAIDLVN